VAGGGLRVVIATANCSLRMGGEAALPYQYFRFLRLREVDVHLVTCARNRAELEAGFPADRDRIHYAPDDWAQRALYRLGRRMPDKFYRATLGFLALMALHARQRRLIRELVRDRGIDVVHQPYPVSPAEPSLIYSVGAPVVIGPMNGGMDYPPGFRDQENRWESAAVGLGRRLRDIATRLLPGKRRARILLIANRRSRDYLPRSVRGEVFELAENGVDLVTWGRPGERGGLGGPARFVYLGRLVGWKGIDLLLKAWASLRPPPSGRLTIIGDGPIRGTLEALRDRLGLTHSVEFAGFLPQAECARRLAHADVLVLPSLIESAAGTWCWRRWLWACR
jgi:glycosyltransferase involved in cell wall biosynthesis